jgi:nucleoside-diphosphate-sugar epimerase
VDYVIHAAASTDLSLPLGRARQANLFPTQRVLAAARRIPGLKRFVHLSTAYACGRRRGRITEDDGASSSFHNFYEQSKREAEAAVLASGLPAMVLRPSMIVGRSDDGYVSQMKVLYSVWRIWMMGLLPRAPVSLAAWVDIVPVDYVVAATLALMREPNAAGKVVHLVAGSDRQRAGTLLHTAARNFAVAPPPVWPVWIARAFHAGPLNRTLPHNLRQLLDHMYWHLPYLGIKDRLFSSLRADELLEGTGVRRPAFASYGDLLFQFLKDTEWGKRPLLKCPLAQAVAAASSPPAEEKLHA